ncbi:hypothetical protein LX36DRAFT_249585, partial [Colletotrichum falcatum]
MWIASVLCSRHRSCSFSAYSAPSAIRIRGPCHHRGVTKGGICSVFSSVASCPSSSRFVILCLGLLFVPLRTGASAVPILLTVSIFCFHICCSTSRRCISTSSARNEVALYAPLITLAALAWSLFS